MKHITESQHTSLVNKIYESLISNPEFGLGEMGDCRTESERIVTEWMEENGIAFGEEVDSKIVGGIGLFDIKHYAKENEIELTDEQAVLVLGRYEDLYQNGGDGLHGDELIDHCIDEIKD